KIENIIRKDFSKWNTIKLRSEKMQHNEIETLKSIMKNDNSNFVIIQGNGIYDGRIFKYLKEEIALGNCHYVKEKSNIETPYIFSTSSEFINFSTLEKKSESIDQFILNNKSIKPIYSNNMDCYIKKLRRRMVPYLIKVEDQRDLKRGEQRSFISVYKGATDFITKYVYPIPVRLSVKLLSPTCITPNHITFISMVLSFGAIPFFFIGWFWTAITMGIVMSLLDSIDGKLARLTIRISTSGDLMDHVSDIVYLAVWYFGLGWHLSNGNILNFQSNIVIATWALVVFYFIDRALLGLFKTIFKAELHDYTSLDSFFRIYVARRNPFLLVMIISMILNRPEFGLYAATVWTLITFLFHLFRAIYLPLSGKKHQSDIDE
ncbi:MAG: CDP-alcohol phosphatidyltransferase family protein, partial [Spirochaetota bacterium]|nr:CDP-alcohol phosphatidyltransferase family protein [Spirochaetota bacterium]